MDRIQTELDLLNGIDLMKVKNMVNERIEKEYHKKENFMYHDKIDDYIYMVHYEDGDSRTFCFGKKAYDEYIRSKSAYKITRKTKDLFPVYEFLIEKC